MSSIRYFLESGEVIRAKDLFGFIPEAVYRVEYQEEGMVHLSAGEIIVGTHPAALVILERGLTKPQSWTATEVAVLRNQVDRCGCPDCYRALEEKQGKLSQEMVH